jgi:AraC-like DNA-binding protein
MDLIFDSRDSDSPFVEGIYRTQTERPGEFISAAEYRWEMVVMRYQGRSSIALRGPETKATQADYPAGAEFFGIIFKPGTYMPHLPIKTLRDRKDMTLPEATNQSFWLLGMAWQMPNFENADTFVQRLVREDLLVRDPVVEAVLHEQQPDYSTRSIQRRFSYVTGLTLKTMQQIQRAQAAVTLLQQGTPILDTSYQLGYFDQSHLSNALKRFYGQTPAQILLPGQG